MPPVILLTDARRLPYGRYASHETFSVSISAGYRPEDVADLPDDPKQVLPPLLPWRWNHIDFPRNFPRQIAAVTVWACKDERVERVSCDVWYYPGPVDGNDPFKPDNLQRLAEHHENRLAYAFTKGELELGWEPDPDGNRTSESSDQQTRISITGRLLREASSLAPLNFGLGLAVIVEVKKADISWADRLFFLPEYGNYFGEIVDDPVFKQNGRILVATLEHSTGEIGAIANCSEAPINYSPTPAKPLPTDVYAALSSDWMSQLETHISPQFDLADLLLDWAEKGIEKTRGGEIVVDGKFLLEAAVPVLKWIVAASRDLCEFGRWAPPSGKSVADQIIGALSPDNVKSAMEKWDMEKSSPEKWLQFIGALSGLSGELASLARTILDETTTLGAPLTLDEYERRVRMHRSLVTILREDDAARIVMEAQWKEVGDGLGMMGPKLIEQAKGYFQANGQLAAKLQQGLVGRQWRDWFKATANGAMNLGSKFAEKIGATVTEYAATAHAENGSWPIYPKRLSNWDGYAEVAAQLGHAVTSTLADAFVKSRASIVTVPHELVFPVRTAADDTSTTDDDGDDQWLIFAARDEESNTAWLSLTAAETVLVSKQTRQPLPGLLFAPLTLAPHHGVLLPNLSYNAHSLAAESPGSGLLPIGTPDQTEPYDVTLQVPTANPEAKIPGLIYGSRYRFVSARMLLHGVLPKDLVRRDDAGNLLHPAARPKLPVTFSSTEQAFSYRRRVGVGLPAMAETARRAQPGTLRLPPIPTEVRPLAWEVIPNLGGVDEIKGRRPPLLVLRPVQNQTALLQDEPTFTPFRFFLTPPTTGLENWDRWVAGGSAPLDRDQRAEVRAREKYNLAKGTPPPELLDPALENYVVAELEIHFGAVERKYRVEVAYLQETTEMRSHIAVEIAAGAFSGPQSPAAGRLRMTLPPGMVAYLRLYPVTTKKNFERFDHEAFFHRSDTCRWSNVADNDWNSITDASTLADLTHVLFTPSELVIEIPTKRMPTQEELWEALQVECGDRTVAARISPKPIGENKAVGAFAYVTKATVQFQLWSWRGWQHERFPFEAASRADEPDGPIFKWDAEGFGSRADLEHESRIDEIKWNPKLNETTTKARVEIARLLTLEHAGDPRAHYYRISGMVRSRYQAYFSELEACQALRTHTTGTGEKIRDRWKRCIVPPRLTGPMPRPAVHLVLPLTRRIRQSDDPSHSTSPGMLIVFDEPWYAQAGLAETLQIEVLTVKEDEAENYFQAGYDPIFDRRSFSPAAKFLKPRYDLPVGLTFDANAEAPLLRRSCLYLRLETDARGTGVPPWFLCQVRLRREVDSQALALARGREADDVRTFNSEWTPPEWIQFLPDAISLLPAGWRHDDHAILDKEPLKLAGWSEPEWSNRLAANGANIFDYWFVITGEITDLAGRKQETFVRMLGWNEKGDLKNLLPVESDTALSGEHLWIRVLQLRVDNAHGTEGVEARQAFRTKVGQGIETEKRVRKRRADQKAGRVDVIQLLFPRTDSERSQIPASDPSGQIVGISPAVRLLVQ